MSELRALRYALHVYRDVLRMRRSVASNSGVPRPLRLIGRHKLCIAITASGQQYGPLGGIAFATSSRDVSDAHLMLHEFGHNVAVDCLADFVAACGYWGNVATTGPRRSEPPLPSLPPLPPLPLKNDPRTGLRSSDDALPPLPVKNNTTTAPSVVSEVPPTEYGATNPEEDLCESVAMFFLQPTYMRTHFPIRFDFFTKLVASWKPTGGPGDEDAPATNSNLPPLSRPSTGKPVVARNRVRGARSELGEKEADALRKEIKRKAADVKAAMSKSPPAPKGRMKQRRSDQDRDDKKPV
jgi:hypothetical protein